MATDARVLSLYAAGGLGQIVVSVLAAAPLGMACLPYVQPSSVQIYEAATDNFAAATEIGIVSSATGILVRDGLVGEVTRYYWAAALDSDGNRSERYPAGGGVAATTKTTVPPDGSITEEKLADGALSKKKFIPGITPVEIVTSLPATGNYAGRMVFRTADGKLYRHTGSPANAAGFTAAVPAPDIVGQITTVQITDDAITAPKIRVNNLAAISANLGVVTAGTLAANVAYLGVVSAAQIAATSLSAISANLGTVTAGTITSVTYTGGLIRTSAGTDRLQMDGDLNEFAVYRAGVKLARLGPVPSGEFGAILSIIDGTAARPVLILSSGVSSGSGIPALRVSRSGFGQAIHASNTYPSGHGMLVDGYNTTSHIGISGYAFYATKGPYGPFTGSHDALLRNGEYVSVGEIVCSTGRVIAKSSVDDALLEVSVSEAEQQRGAYGIVRSVAAFDPMSVIAALPPLHDKQPPTPVRRWIADNYQRLSVNGCGEGLLLVCGRGGDIEVGDYICCSSMRGKGQRQNDADGEADDLLRRHTVAQATQTFKFDHPDQVKLISCIYRCG